MEKLAIFVASRTFEEAVDVLVRAVSLHDDWLRGSPQRVLLWRGHHLHQLPPGRRDVIEQIQGVDAVEVEVGIARDGRNGRADEWKRDTKVRGPKSYTRTSRRLTSSSQARHSTLPIILDLPADTSSKRMRVRCKTGKRASGTKIGANDLDRTENDTAVPYAFDSTGRPGVNPRSPDGTGAAGSSTAARGVVVGSNRRIWVKTSK